MTIENPEESMFERRTSPEIRYESDSRTLFLRWENTGLRIFEEGDGIYNHILHETEDGEALRFFAQPEVCKLLIEEEFPQQLDQVADEDTKNWIIESHNRVTSRKFQELLAQELN
ncbi:MAG: hypothetical protein WCP03_00625 [Candidatus Saccharibacteria bacterium]